jgi:hypothetical protein
MTVAQPPPHTQADWLAANQRCLGAALDRLRGLLERHAALAAEHVGAAPPLDEAAALDADQPPAEFALERLRTVFGLTTFERDTLLLCAAVELDARFGALYATAQGSPERVYPTFSLALAALPGAHWSALTPAAPLRYWRLLDVLPGPTLTLSPLRVDERVLHELVGLAELDNRLRGLLEPVPAPETLTPTLTALAERVAGAWRRAAGRPPLLELTGPESVDKAAVAARAAGLLGLRLWRLPSEAAPGSLAELETFTRLWEREAALGGGALLVDAHGEHAGSDQSDNPRAAQLEMLLARCDGPRVLATRERRAVRGRTSLALEVGRPSPDEQRALWRAALDGAQWSLNGKLDDLVTQFSLGPLAIAAAGVEARALAGSESELGDLLWQASRDQARPRLDNLAARLEPAARWDDLVLPEAQLALLREVAIHVRQRATVYDAWGFAARGARGLGISALFAGPSGTGKTTAAEALANELRLDLYRIDLAALVSKYIGETEKNLRRVFDAAEEGGAILLFDEADALFGKRSDVKDSHDRYANIEVSYLLQRMETYRGLAILTTNMRQALDQAFLRRIRFVVSFPFPDASLRAELWRRVFPSATPTEGLDIARLARLNIAGGNIRNIALNAAFLAAEAREPVRMGHLLRAAHGEYAKLEKPLTTAEIDLDDWA